MEVINMSVSNIHSIIDKTNNYHESVYAPKDNERFYTKEDYEMHNQKIKASCQKLVRNLDKQELEKQIDLYYKIHGSIHRNNDVVVFEQQIEVPHYCYADPITGESIRITKSQFYSKNEDKYPNRHVFVSITFEQIAYENLGDYVEDLKQSLYDENSSTEFLNTYEVINQFTFEQEKRYIHVIPSGSNKNERDIITANAKAGVYDSHTFVKSCYKMNRKRVEMQYFCQDADDYDIVTGYTKNGKAKHYKNNKTKQKHINKTIELLINHPWYHPVAIIKTHNGCQTRYAYDTDYYIAQKDETVKKMNLLFGDKWVTLEGYQNLQYARSEYMQDYMLSNKQRDFLDKRCTNTSTRVLRGPLTKHYKEDNKNVSLMEIVYAAEHIERYSPEELCDKMYDDVKGKNKRLEEIIFLTKKNLKTRVLVRKKLEVTKKKTCRRIPINVISNNKLLTMMYKENYKGIIGLVRENERDNFMTFKEGTLWDVAKELNTIDLKKYLPPEDLEYAVSKNFRYSNKDQVRYLTFCGNPVVYDPNTYQVYNFVNLMKRTTGKKKSRILNGFLNAADIKPKYIGKDMKLKTYIGIIEQNIANVEIAIAMVKGKFYYKRMMLQKVLRCLEHLKKIALMYHNYKLNRHVKDEFMFIALNLIQQYIEEYCHGNDFLRKHKYYGADIMMNILCAMGMAKRYHLNKIQINHKTYENPNASLVQVIPVSVNEILSRVTELIEKKDVSKKGNIFSSRLQDTRLRQYYGDEIAELCSYHEAGDEVVKKDKYVLNSGVKYRNVDRYNLTKYEHDWCNVQRMYIYSFLRSKFTDRHKYDYDDYVAIREKIFEWIEKTMEKAQQEFFPNLDGMIENLKAYTNNLMRRAIARAEGGFIRVDKYIDDYLLLSDYETLACSVLFRNNKIARDLLTGEWVRWKDIYKLGTYIEWDECPDTFEPDYVEAA